MKRYVKEFLNDEINKHDELWKHYGNMNAVHVVAKLKNILAMTEKGFLTDFEAVKMAVENIEKWEA